MLSKVNVSARLYLLVGLMALIAVVVGIFGVNGMSGTVAGLRTVYEDRTVPMVQLARIQRLLNLVQLEMYAALQHAPSAEYSKLHDHAIEVHFAAIDRSLKEVDEDWKACMATYLTPEEKVLAGDFEKRYEAFRNAFVAPALAAFRKGDFSVAAVGAFINGRRAIGTPTNDTVQKLLGYQETVAKEEFNKAVSSYATTRALAIGLNVGGLLLAGLLALAIVRSLVDPLKSMQVAIVSAERDRDFTHRAEVREQDEVGKTATAFNNLMQTLQQTFGAMRGNVTRLNRAAHELSSTAQQAAAGSNDSSEAASSMAASVEEMTVSVTHIADNARDASTLSCDSGKQAEEGGKIIHDTTNEIQAIASTVNQSSIIIGQLGEQSGRISGIVSVIREVAGRTNLLALNAAIEAARAGDEGRGFAVVADEVRKLAERTAASTAEIAAMVDTMQNAAREAVAAMNGTVNKVAAGVALARGAEDAMRSIHGSATRVVTVVADMSAALAEQSAAANAIAQQVERVAQGADQSSAAARGTSDSAQELANLADEMDQELARFKV